MSTQKLVTVAEGLVKKVLGRINILGQSPGRCDRLAESAVAVHVDGDRGRLVRAADYGTEQGFWFRGC